MTNPRRALRRLFPRIALALVFGLAAGSAFAAPGEAADPLMKIVADQAQAADPVVVPAPTRMPTRVPTR